MTWLAGLADHLAELGHGTYTPTATTGTIFVEKIPQTPDVCLAIYPGPTGESDSGLAYDDVAFQLRTRGDTDGDPRTSAAALQAIYDDLHGNGDVTLDDGTVLLDVLATQSTPIPLGPDANNRFEHSLNFRAELHNTTRPSTRD
jgi:hypothetical protein